jgi:hypothetical protein
MHDVVGDFILHTGHCRVLLRIYRFGILPSDLPMGLKDKTDFIIADRELDYFWCAIILVAV